MTSAEFIGYLRWVYILSWGTVVGFHFMAFLRSFSPRCIREHDPFWSTYCLTGINRLLLAGTWLFIIPKTVSAGEAAYDVVAYGMGIYVAFVMIRQPFWYDDRP